MPSDYEESDFNESKVTRLMSVYKHRKKQAANDAQLLLNRIALIQKEEERAKKKIEQTKERAMEILAVRSDNAKRVQEYVQANSEVKEIQNLLLQKNKGQDIESKQARRQRIEQIKLKRKEDAVELKMEKQVHTQVMIEEQEKALKEKQRKREEVKRMEEEMRLKKEEERREKERRMKELYEQRLAAEEYEAKKAEKLVKALEKKEREWIEKLRSAQTIQEAAFEQLETALIHDEGLPIIPMTTSMGNKKPSILLQTTSPQTPQTNMITSSSRGHSSGSNGSNLGGRSMSANKLSMKKKPNQSMKIPKIQN